VNKQNQNTLELCTVAAGLVEIPTIIYFFNFLVLYFIVTVIVKSVTELIACGDGVLEEGLAAPSPPARSGGVLQAPPAGSRAEP